MRLASLGGMRRWAAAALAGVVLAPSQAPVSFPWVVFLALPVLVWLLEGARRPWQGFRIGWFAGLGYFAATMFWIVEPFFVEPEIYGWMAPFALVGLTGGLALFWAAAFAGAAAFRCGRLARILLLACLWTAAEYARSHLLTGFPWGLLAYGWIGTPFAQALSLVGPHGLGLVTLLIAMLPACLAWRPTLVAGILLALLAGFGLWRESLPVPGRGDGLVVRVVQPNADQRLKWLPGYSQLFYERLLRGSAAPPARGTPPQVTIWPETAVPFALGDRPELQAEMAAYAGPETTLILGINRRQVTPDGEDWFNALAVLAPGSGAVEAVYDKHHLVPFGEYIPLAGQIRRLGLPALAGLVGRGFSAGPGPQIVTAPGVPPFLPLICYEAIFPDEARVPDERPDWLVQVTNDAWFGRIAGPYQHLAQARARAIETGLPMVRAANTGVSAIIDPMGRITGRIDLGEQGHVDGILAARLKTTPYVHFGDWLGLIAMLLIFLLTVLKVYGGFVVPLRTIKSAEGGNKFRLG